MNEPSTGSFPTMGTSAAQLSSVGRPERGRMRPRGNGKSGDLSGPTSHRSMSHERMGASLHPTAVLYEANAACAQDTGKRVAMMPSRSSWTDSWRSAAKRATM